MVSLGPYGDFGLGRMPGFAFGCFLKVLTLIGESWQFEILECS